MLAEERITWTKEVNYVSSKWIGAASFHVELVLSYSSPVISFWCRNIMEFANFTTYLAVGLRRGRICDHQNQVRHHQSELEPQLSHTVLVKHPAEDGKFRLVNVCIIWLCLNCFVTYLWLEIWSKLIMNNTWFIMCDAWTNAWLFWFSKTKKNLRKLL